MRVYWSTDAYAPDDTSLPELARQEIYLLQRVELVVESFFISGTFLGKEFFSLV